MTQPAVPAEFLGKLEALRHQAEAEGAGRIPRRDIFALAKEFVDTPPAQIEAMLDHPDLDVRTGGVCVMDFQARRRTTSPDRRRELCDLYLRRHDRIDSWDLVDRAAPSVVGGYLFDRSREPLFLLARSAHPMERRTAIVATYYFIRHGDLADTFAIADLLAHDPDDLVQKAVGGWIREAGKRDLAPLRSFLDRHAATMPRTALRYATEHLPEEERQHYLALGRTGTHGSVPRRR
jgi:DNA alkylation repair enzyme